MFMALPEYYSHISNPGVIHRENNIHSAQQMWHVYDVTGWRRKTPYQVNILLLGRFVKLYSKHLKLLF